MFRSLLLVGGFIAFASSSCNENLCEYETYERGNEGSAGQCEVVGVEVPPCDEPGRQVTIEIIGTDEPKVRLFLKQGSEEEASNTDYDFECPEVLPDQIECTFGANENIPSGPYTACLFGKEDFKDITIHVTSTTSACNSNNPVEGCKDDLCIFEGGEKGAQIEKGDVGYFGFEVPSCSKPEDQKILFRSVNKDGPVTFYFSNCQDCEPDKMEENQRRQCDTVFDSAAGEYVASCEVDGGQGDGFFITVAAVPEVTQTDLDLGVEGTDEDCEKATYFNLAMDNVNNVKFTNFNLLFGASVIGNIALLAYVYKLKQNSNEYKPIEMM